MEQSDHEFDLDAELTYADAIGGARVRAQGINCVLTAETFELADAKGTLNVTKDVLGNDLEALFGVELDQSYRVEITVSPVGEALR